jgi:hypothetical protein
MALLKRKQEKTTTLSVRVPVSVKQEMDASLTDAVVKWTKQVREELTTSASSAHSVVHKSHTQNASDADRA